MRLDKPRIEMLAVEDVPAGVRKALGKGSELHIFRTLAHHPKLLEDWLRFGNRILVSSTLPARERELAVLRVGWLCRAGYEWGQHALIGELSGLSKEEIARVTSGPSAAGWSEVERLVLQATDELHEDYFIVDETWKGLTEHFSTQQIFDLIFLVGQYHLVSMALNSVGIQPERGLPPLPES
ncbi:MAG: carboxymuconolactone decarboxylase family protein [Deltaproteobacteria bacterium]